MLWQVNQKMILMLTASIMYWSLQQSVEEISPSPAAVNTPDASGASSIGIKSYPSPTLSTTPDASPTHSVNGESSRLPGAANAPDDSPAPSISFESSPSSPSATTTDDVSPTLPIDDDESSPVPAPDASAPPFINGNGENATSVSGKILSLAIGDGTSDIS